MTKEELIEKTYGPMWHKLSESQRKYCLKNNGTISFPPTGGGTPKLLMELWDYFRSVNSKMDDQDYGNSFTSYHTPITLLDLSINNGWTKYVDENTWPQNKDLWYDVCKFHPEKDNPSEPLKIHRRMTALEVIHLCNDGIITHWREHKEELKPKY